MEILFVKRIGYGILQIDVTNKCNLRCWFCRRDKLKRDTLTLEILKDIFIKAKGFGFTVLNVSGGEPLLRPDIVEILKVAKKYFKEVTITTNGTVPIPEEVFKYTDLVQVSIDGDEKVHEANRGVEGIYQKILRNLRSKREKNVVVKTVYFKQDTNSLIRLGKDIEGLVKYWSIRPIIKKGIIITRQEFFELLGKLSQHVNVDIISEDPIYITYLKLDDIKDGIGGCIAGWGGLYMNSQGEIYPCAYLPIKLGDVFEEGLDFWEIFENPVMKSLRNRNGFKNCGQCSMINLCGGCRAIAYLNTGDYLAKDPRCNYEYSL